MIFSLLVLIIIGLVAFYHYTQGMWSAMISAFCAAIAALVAMSYHEPLAHLLVAAKMVNQAHSIMLVLLFTLTYVILRVTFDKMIPGNIRLPLLMDKIGAGVMGIIAAVFATGILAIAAQALPFGPSIAGYSRYELEDDREVSVSQGQRQMLDTFVKNELTGDSFDPANRQGLMVPVDNMVVALTKKQSSSGALSGARPLESVHPNYLDELFGTRIGMEPGTQRVAMNEGEKQHVKVEGVYRLPKITRQVDAEVGSTRSTPINWPADPPSGKTFLVVRTMFDSDAADDTDKLLRLSPASVRLVTPSTEFGGWHNYTPTGTLENGVLFANKPDDYLFVDFAVGSGADFVFLVDQSDVMVDPNAPDPKVQDGVFLEVKRMARVDLSDKPVSPPLPPSDAVQLLRKGPVLDQAKKAGGGQLPPAPAGGAGGSNAPTPPTPPSPPAAPGGASTPISIKQAQVNNMLFSPINTGTPEANANGIQVASGTLSLRDGKFAKLDISPVQTLTLMRQGSYTVSELFVPEGQRLVQVSAEPPAEGGDPWAWADSVTEFKLKDAGGTTYNVHGAFAKVRSGREDRMVAVYDADAPISGVSRDENRPTEVYLAFLVPVGTQLASLDFHGQPVQAVKLTAQ